MSASVEVAAKGLHHWTWQYAVANALSSLSGTPGRMMGDVDCKFCSASLCRGRHNGFENHTEDCVVGEAIVALYEASK